MPRQDDESMGSDLTFDALIDRIRARDDTPGPGTGFTRSLEKRLTRLDVQNRRDKVHTHTTVLDQPSAWPAPQMRRGVRWAALAATIALLLITVSAGYLSGIELPDEGEPATEISAPTLASPTVQEAAEIGDPETATSCNARKSYLSAVQGRTHLDDPAYFGEESFTLDRLQMQRWALGPSAVQVFGSMPGSTTKGLALDTVAGGVYQGTFKGPVIVTTTYGEPFSQTFTRLEENINMVELGPGESVLFEIGTPHSFSNLSSSRTLSVERAYFYAGDVDALKPEGVDHLPTVYGPYKAEDSVAPYAVSARVSGSGEIAPGDAPDGWLRTAIILEYIAIFDAADGLDEIVPPCELSGIRQVRDVTQILSSQSGSRGYLVWIGEGGRG